MKKTPEEVAEDLFARYGYRPGGYRDMAIMDVHKDWMMRAIEADREQRFIHSDEREEE